MNPKLAIDISLEDFETVKNILAKYIKHVEVWAFGSRVTGRARRFSDLDLAIITTEPLDFDLYAELKEAFSESDLPFKVDIVDWAATSEVFKKKIKEKFVVIQP